MNEQNLFSKLVNKKTVLMIVFGLGFCLLITEDNIYEYLISKPYAPVAFIGEYSILFAVLKFYRGKANEKVFTIASVQLAIMNQDISNIYNMIRFIAFQERTETTTHGIDGFGHVAGNSGMNVVSSPACASGYCCCRS